MGEETVFDYNNSQTNPSVYTNTFPVKIEEQQDNHEMVPYTLSTSEQVYCAEPENMMHTATTDKTVNNQENTFDDFIHGRPLLHHMPSISTTCTSDSFQSNLTSPDSAEVYTGDINTSDPNMFDWSHTATAQFHWPPNHNLATPPLDSPVNFHQLGYPGQIPHLEKRPPFPTTMQNPSNFYPLTPSTRRPSQAALTQYQPYATTAPEMLHSLSSGGNSQTSTTPTIQSPPLSNTPRPTKKGSISTDIPTGRNRGQSLTMEMHDSTTAVRDSTRRRSSLSASQHHLSRSPNRAHHRRASGLPTPSFAMPISQDLFDDKKPGRLQIKRSKSANTILTNPSPEETVENENESSGEERPDDLAKTKAARAQSEHRRRVELKESFERLRIALGVPQPRAGKKDLVEQAIMALDYYKRKENEMLQEITYLRSTHQKWTEEMMGEEMQL